MKNVIYQNYGFVVVGMIKINDNVYKIKTRDQNYVLKITTNQNINTIYEYVDTLHLRCFITIIPNREQQFLTPYQSQYFYLMPYVDVSLGLLKEMKIKFYFETLAYIHEKSFYYTKVNQSYFQTLHDDILKIIHERTYYYDQMIRSFENIAIRSPSQWMLVLNYYRIYEALCQSRQYLSQYMELTSSYQQIRVCLNYKNFDYDHISLKSQLLLSIDSMCIDLPIYDLFDLYQKIPDILFDLDCFSEYYFQKIALKDDEKLLLCCLMNIAPIITFQQNEIENIIKLSRLLYYLDSIQQFMKSCH